MLKVNHIASTYAVMHYIDIIYAPHPVLGVCHAFFGMPQMDSHHQIPQSWEFLFVSYS